MVRLQRLLYRGDRAAERRLRRHEHLGANENDGTLSKLLASSGTALATITVGSGPFGVAFDGTNIWVANYADSTVTKVLASSGAVVGTYAAGTGANSLAFDGTNIWVANVGSNTVTKIGATR